MSPENITHGWGERAATFLRRLYPYGTARNVAGDLGVSVRTAEKWMDGSASMNADALMRALAVYGPPFLVAVFPRLAWVEAAAALFDADALDAKAAQLAARRTRALAALRGRT